MLTIDTHTHIVAPDRERYPLTPHNGALGGWVEAKPVSAEELLAEMDAAGVDRALLVQASSAYGFENAYVADSALKRLDRYAGVCIIDMLAPDAAGTLTKLVLHHGMRGLRLFTTSEPEAPWLDDPRTFPVWERVRELRVPVIVQMSARHLPRLRKLLDSYGDVPVALDHLAGAASDAGNTPSPELLALADLPNIYLKLSTLNLYACERRGVACPEYFGPLIERFGADRLMWGSNYPNTYDRSYCEMVDLARNAFSYLSPADQESLFGGSALRLWPELA